MAGAPVRRSPATAAHLAVERRALRRLIDFEVLVDADARPCAD
jgi:hypothetical protein